MKLAIDVCIGIRGAKRLRDAGHEVVVIAEHAERDEDWFARALAADVDILVSADSDLEILCYDHRVRFLRAKVGLSGVENAQRVIDTLKAWGDRWSPRREIRDYRMRKHNLLARKP